MHRKRIIFVQDSLRTTQEYREYFKEDETECRQKEPFSALGFGPLMHKYKVWYFSMFFAVHGKTKLRFRFYFAYIRAVDLLTEIRFCPTHRIGYYPLNILIIESGIGQDFDPVIAQVFLDIKDKVSPVVKTI